MLFSSQVAARLQCSVAELELKGGLVAAENSCLTLGLATDLVHSIDKVPLTDEPTN